MNPPAQDGTPLHLQPDAEGRTAYPMADIGAHAAALPAGFQGSRLAARKAQLVEEGRRQRAAAAESIRLLRTPSTWLSSGQRALGACGPWIYWAAPIAGFLLARHWRFAARWLAKPMVVWRLARRIRPFWRLFWRFYPSL
ncbi:MAG TPA: hypothetical protein P5555_00200 [Candidatus Paceibacterota bacterium]|nr:hypothetical protein [Verrucomicrobiota bacterium]HOX00883.1 hypothetical protein [Verrucomicrobiota bacterium]HRZ43592.1 hypothetical protein [Candidatus Paceibacterota bacterium]HRZ91609.1 hypothetical protein [Candidatus Paceibacterota bacterium]